MGAGKGAARRAQSKLPVGAKELNIDYSNARSNKLALDLARKRGSRTLVEAAATDSESADLIMQIVECERHFDPQSLELTKQLEANNPQEFKAAQRFEANDPRENLAAQPVLEIAGSDLGAVDF
jgi:hypothetical protein